MSEITVLKKPAEEMDDLDQKFDLVYLDPPFGLQRDFNMVESDGREKGFRILGNPLMIILIGMPRF